MKELEQAISKTKKSLIKKLKHKGMYEDFGDEEVEKLKNKFVGLRHYSSTEEKEARRLINDFFEWCINYEVKK